MYQPFLKEIRNKSPLIHVLTNNVSNLFVADALLAIGASPIMGFDPSEAAQICKASDAVCINTGTPHPLMRKSYSVVLKTCLKNEIPVALDFPGVPASSERQKTASKLLSLLSKKKHKSNIPSLLRGNASEILCMAEGLSRGGSIDSMHTPDELGDYPLSLLKSVQAVCMSGTENIIFDNSPGKVRISGGSSLMTRSSGFGCVSTALMACFLAVSTSLYPESPAASASQAVCLLMKDAALSITPDCGPSVFRNSFIDALFYLSEKEITK